MAEPLCSCCKLFGKPSARVNFIIATGSSDSFMYQRVKYLMENYAKDVSTRNDACLTNFGSLTNVSKQLFTDKTNLSSFDQSASPETQTCCHGFTVLPVDIDNIDDSSHKSTFEKDILNLLNLKTNSKNDKQNIKSQPANWIMLSGSMWLERSWLDIFLRFSKKKSIPTSFTFTVLCFLVDEQQLFENWLNRDQPFQKYESETYSVYKRAIDNFFLLLNSSEDLQKRTLLINEQDLVTDNKLQTLLQNIFRNRPRKHKAEIEKIRYDMSQLLSPCRREAHNIQTVLNNLRKACEDTIMRRLKSLFDDLKQTATATRAAREIVHIVLNEFDQMNGEELRCYKKRLTLGFDDRNTEHSNTIAAELVRYALYLLEKNIENSTALIYAIVLAVRQLGTHYIFRHNFFNNTPEIYTLSLLLITQRHYALVLGGLRLCTVILKADKVEHKYALAYLKHDPFTARKILDTIRWLLSPYITLKNLCKSARETKDEKNDFRLQGEELILHLAERFTDSLRHAEILLDDLYIRHLASLFYGASDHCAQVTENDIHNFTEVIGVLADPDMIYWTTLENSVRTRSMLISNICSFLTPILLYNSSSLVHVALTNETDLLSYIPQGISHLFETKHIDEYALDAYIRFYTLFIRSKYKQQKIVGDSQNEENKQVIDTNIIENKIDPSTSLILHKDLISSYFDLERHIQAFFLSDEKSTQKEKIRALLDDEWKKLEIVQLEIDKQRLDDDRKSLEQKLAQLTVELQYARAEIDQLNIQNKQLAQQNNRLKLAFTTKQSQECVQSSIVVSTNNSNVGNINDELGNLEPRAITKQQAEQFIKEIQRRLTEFCDPYMRKLSCGSIKLLGADLYTSPVHFLHELIQNADDNYYDTVKPCLRIEMNQKYILLSNNEKGLRTKDVSAICNLGDSTKTEDEELIGEKGVGFKSVFAVSNQSMLFSHAWKFRFRVPGPDAMSYIIPLWIEDEDIPNCIAERISTYRDDTHLYLPLKVQVDISDAKPLLDQVATAVDPCILLNMRRLEKLEIVDKRTNERTLIEKTPMNSTQLENQSHVTFEGYTFIDLARAFYELKTSSEQGILSEYKSTKCSMFRVYTCRIEIPNPTEDQQSAKTQLLLAFPCEKDYQLRSTVYTGLPVCDLGFNFLFNAKFQLVTNRENVRENVLSNAYIRDHLATLLVYLLLNDTDLRKDIGRFCPSDDTPQLKYFPWWLSMVRKINSLITVYLPYLLDIDKGKTIRSFNVDLSLLVSNEQLSECAGIYVIDSEKNFFTTERLKLLNIQSVSITDILNCFPNRDDTTADNESCQQFRARTQEKDQQWWSEFFRYISQNMSSDVSKIMLEKPIFLLQNNQQRQYLPKANNVSSILYISDDPSFVMWKKQLTLLYYSSASEKTALLASNHVLALTPKKMIEIIGHHHLQLANSLSVADTDVQRLIKEIWNDLFYLKFHIKLLDKSTPYVVPVNNTSNFETIQMAMLPTIFGVNMCSFMNSTTFSIILQPYPNTDYSHLIEILEWEHFLLEMNCKRPSIHSSKNFRADELPFLPALTKFTDEKCARLGEWIFSAQTDDTKKSLPRFPVVGISDGKQQICSISATFDEDLVHDLSSASRITIPSHCRSLAINLGVHVEYDLRTCVTALQLLSNSKNTNIDLYREWLGYLQLYARQQREHFDSENLLSACQLYLPDQNHFYSFKDLLVISDDGEHPDSLQYVFQYMNLPCISSSTNKIYWPFKDLFYLLDCTRDITLDHISNAKIKDLYRTVVENKHPTAPCGSPDDLRWRFSLTRNTLAKQLKKLISKHTSLPTIDLPTIDLHMIRKTTENIVYACLEEKIIRNLMKNFDKRYFILPEIARTCPLILALHQIDYIEQRGKVEWRHANHNIECYLPDLTNIFRQTSNDANLEVMQVKYVNVNLILFDSLGTNSNDEQNGTQTDGCRFDSEYPFWIFDKIVLLCIGYIKTDQVKATVAAMALATLLHKRNYMSVEKSKSIAEQNISQCSKFRSDIRASVADEPPITYSYINLLFPIDHPHLDTISILIEEHRNVEENVQRNIRTPRVATDRLALDQVYRERVRTQNHLLRNINETNNVDRPVIVDGDANLRIGENAEHFFFLYLQECYGKAYVTKENWRSSARLVTFQQDEQGVDDAVGFDFELADKKQLFVRGSEATTKYCYFEVKGINGSYNRERTRFHISQNERRTCQEIARNTNRRNPEAYCIVIIQNCLDPEKIGLGPMLNWSDNFGDIKLTVDSYLCEIISSSHNLFHNNTTEVSNYDSRQQQVITSDTRNDSSTVQSTQIGSDDSKSKAYRGPHSRNQQEKDEWNRMKHGTNNKQDDRTDKSK